MQTRRTPKLQAFFPILLIASCYVGLVAFLSPYFEFPLNDDAVYAKAVEYFVQNRSLRLSDWIAVSFVFQLFYGAAFSIPFGFSFSVLRISTLLLSFVGAVSLFLILMELGFSKTVSLLGTLVLVTNPVYLNLSYTFMTDVPFLSMTLLSVFFYLRAIVRGSDRYLVLGSLFAILAGLIRQPGILLPFTVLVFYVLSGRAITFRRISALVVFPASAYGVYLAWLVLVHGLPQATSGYLAKAIQFELAQIVKSSALISFAGVQYLGLFVLPLTLALIAELLKLMRHRTVFVVYVLWGVVVGLGVIVVYVTTENRLTIPYSGNIINNFGLGPFTLRDTVILQKEKPVVLPDYFWWGITILSSLSAVAVLSGITFRFLSVPILPKSLRSMFDSGGDHDENDLGPPMLFIYIIGVAFWLIIVLTGKRFDRYFLMLLLPGMVPLLEQLGVSKHVIPVAIALVLATGLFGLLGTHDYISWNKARWTAIDYLMHEKEVPAVKIDGGYEFNYWYNYDEASARGIRWWWALDDMYVIAFRPLAGYSTMKKFQYSSYLGRTNGYLYVLQRQD